MYTNRISAVRCTAILAAMATLPMLAVAGCGSRPGTPNDLRIEPDSGAPTTSLLLSWQNTTGRAIEERTMFFDISVRDAHGQQVGRDLTGVGPFTDLTYGSRSSYAFDGLRPGQTLCISMRARTQGGTKGCVSGRFSNQVCGTTALTAPPHPPAAHSSPPTGPPQLQVTGPTANSFVVHGTKFEANAWITLRVADAAGRSIYVQTSGNTRLRANAAGSFEATLNGLCQAHGPLYFSATDGRASSVDHTGSTWSNTVQLLC